MNSYSARHEEPSKSVILRELATEESYLCCKIGAVRFFAKAQNDNAEGLMDDMGRGVYQ